MRRNQQNLIIYLKELKIKLGRVPVLDDLRSVKGGPTERTFVRHFSSWNNALFQAGFPLNRKKKWTKKDLIKTLENEARLLGQTPSSTHFRKNHSLPSPSIYIEHFGTWNKALKASNLNIVRIHKYRSKKQLLDGFKKLYVELGRPPTGKDIDSCPYLPSYATFGSRFKTMKNLYFEAGIPIKEDHLWLRWERTCEAVARSLYGEIILQSGKVVDGRPDIYIPQEKLVVDAMTRGYRSKRKISSASRYIVKGGRLEFWCISKGKEVVAKNVRYVY